MKIQVSFVENANMGDHGEFITTAQEVRIGETVEEMCRRLFESTYRSRHASKDSYIIIRPVNEIEPEEHTFSPVIGADDVPEKNGRCIYHFLNAEGKPTPCGRYQYDQVHMGGSPF